MEHFPGFTTLQFCGKVNDLLSDLGEAPDTFTRRILFMSMFNDISCDRKSIKEECLANARVVKVLAKKFGIGQWSFIEPDSEKKWCSGEENSPQGAWDHFTDENAIGIRRKRTSYFPCNDSIVKGILKSKRHAKLSIHFTADFTTIETIFRIIFSAFAEQLRTCVKNLKPIKMDRVNLMC